MDQPDSMPISHLINQPKSTTCPQVDQHFQYREEGGSGTTDLELDRYLTDILDTAGPGAG